MEITHFITYIEVESIETAHKKDPKTDIHSTGPTIVGVPSTKWITCVTLPNKTKISVSLDRNIHFSYMFTGNELRASKRTGPRLNIKTVLSTYGDFHVKDKTAARASYL